MTRTLRVLVVEDSESDFELLVRELRKSEYELVTERVETPEAMMAALTDRSWDMVFSDWSLPRFSAPAALEVLKARAIDIPFIIVSGTVGEDTAVEALRRGAHDFLVKDKLTRLLPAVERELREVASRRRQRDAELSQRETEARFRAIMETATDGVISANQHGSIIYVNPAAERIFGHAASELVGQPLTRLMPERLHERHRSGWSRYLDAGESSIVGRTIELVGIRQDGSEFPMDLSLGTWFTAGEQFFAGIIRDITDRKKVEAQLLVADRMVSVGTLAAGVAHEINNPLAAVMSNLDLSVRDVADLVRQLGASGPLGSLQEQLSDAREASDRVRQIVRDLKIFSRGEREECGPVDVEGVMESTLRMAWNEIRHRSRLVKNYGRVPPVEASESRLGQVFLNIVVNAAQAIAEGHADKNEIRIATSTESDRVVIEICDTGPGMPKEVMARLFTPFVTTKPVGLGTGLGLSICHRIVTEFGGEIGVQSEAGRGTTFRIALPLARSKTQTPAPVAVSPGKASRQGRILVVDDEPLIARAVQRAIGFEHDVVAVHSAREALDLIVGGERFDIILCDLMMPEITGMDFHRELMTRVPDQALAIVFLTGGAFTPRARDFLDAVHNQRVEKPFDVRHLRALINDRIR